MVATHPVVQVTPPGVEARKDRQAICGGRPKGVEMARTAEQLMVAPDTEPDAKGVADSRLQFLTEEAAPARVRPPILASWQRSRALQVAADKIDLPYQADPENDSPLARSAEPVLRHLSERMAGHPVSIVLTDPSGLVVSRRTGDAELERHLDRVHLAPGFSYAEQFVGTNGIGTALEVGAPTQVYGHEHYAEHLEGLACAGAPIHDPLHGRMLGIIDLTCWRRDAESLLLTLAQTTAEQIQQALLVDAGMHEFSVLQAYRQTCHRTNGIVFAVTKDAVLLNERARSSLDPGDQNALLSRAIEVGTELEPGRRRTVEVMLPSGAAARMFCQQVAAGSQPAGVVVLIRLTEPGAAPAGRAGLARAMLLPGLVGEAPLWRRACRDVEARCAEGTWLALEGEAGVGKLALLRAVQVRCRPARRFTVLDAADAQHDADWPTLARQTLANTESVLISHVDVLDARSLRALVAALQNYLSTPGEQPWVAVTVGPGASQGGLDQLMALFPSTVSVPPLRLRLDDIPKLTSFILAKLGQGRQISCSSEAMRMLMRASWPGNVAQLQKVLHEVVQHRRTGVIAVEDLPPEMHSMCRRVLSPLESLERDAIVRSLADAGGNKVQAARALGVSRATIYRKIHEFGIVPS